LFSLKRCSDGDVNGSITKRFRRDTGNDIFEQHIASKKALLFEVFCSFFLNVGSFVRKRKLLDTIIITIKVKKLV